MPSRATIDEVLAQSDLAFVGVSRDPKQFANAVYRHLRDGGRVMHPIHRDAERIEGDPAVPSVADLPDGVGAIVVMLPADDALEVVRQAIDRGIPRVWLHRGIGRGADSPEAVAACREAGVAVVDGACPLMFVEPVGGFHRFHRALAHRRIAA
jgi:predicted CoA-binding protein